MTENPKISIEQILRDDGRYPLEAVQFVREALNHTVDKLHPDAKEDDTPSHISGAQLCFGLRELAQKRWGMLARHVLKSWNINATRDFGEIVFLLVNNDLMQKTPNDSIEDFENVYDFDEAFS